MSYMLHPVRGGDMLNHVNKLQALIMPNDAPCDPNIGWWWLAYDTDRNADDYSAFAGMVQSAQWIDAVYLCRAGVRFAARGKGLQKRLIRVRLAKARALGFRYAVTETHDNPASANSLIACGFRMYKPGVPWAEDSQYWTVKL